jgi:peptidoglycan/xylan/chitin deacetylase (PgdA/CDA1 family)
VRTKLFIAFLVLSLLLTGCGQSTPTPTAVVQASPTATSTPRDRAAIDEPTPSADAGPAPPVLHLVPDAGPRLALTFDGAASANGTADLLKLLQRLDLKVTLFVTGEFVHRYPGIVRTALLAGHEVGNHTYSHSHLTSYAKNRKHELLPSVSRSWFESELRRTEEAFRAAANRAGRSEVEWRASTDDALEATRLSARYADLVIVGQFDENAKADPGVAPNFAEELVLTAGRPVLLRQGGQHERSRTGHDSTDR